MHVGLEINWSVSANCYQDGKLVAHHLKTGELEQKVFARKIAEETRSKCIGQDDAGMLRSGTQPGFPDVSDSTITLPNTGNAVEAAR